MVEYSPRQGDIIRINLNPTKGHEQAGSRPALIISNNFFNDKTNLVIVCPITNTDNNFPLHVRLDGRTKTTGVILCEHVKALDIKSRAAEYIEPLPNDILKDVIYKVFSEVEYQNEQ